MVIEMELVASLMQWKWTDRVWKDNRLNFYSKRHERAWAWAWKSSIYTQLQNVCFIFLLLPDNENKDFPFDPIFIMSPWYLLSFIKCVGLHGTENGTIIEFMAQLARFRKTENLEEMATLAFRQWKTNSKRTMKREKECCKYSCTWDSWEWHIDN